MKENLHAWARFVEDSPTAIAMFDKDMRYLAVSSRWMSDYNLDQEIVGLGHYEVFPEITEDWRRIHRRALKGETLRGDLESFTRLDGSVQWLQWVVAPWFASDGVVGGLVISSFAVPDPQNAKQGQVDGGEAAALQARALAHSPARSEGQRDIIRQLRSGNLFLNHLSQADFDRLNDHLTPISLGPEAVLVEPQQPVDQVYFPLSGLLSLVRHLDDGSAVEISGGGRGGFSGHSVVTGLGFEETETRSLMKGLALVIPAESLRRAMAERPTLHADLLRFSAMLAAQTSVSLACMARHSLDQRLARWLLTAEQRMGDVDLQVRQEDLAIILGVRRTGVSEALARLADLGAIEHGRRRIALKDRALLTVRSCACLFEVEAARRRSVPDVKITPAIPAETLKTLVAQFHSSARKSIDLGDVAAGVLQKGALFPDSQV